MSSVKPADQLDEMIATVGGWRGERLARLRQLIDEAAPDLQLEWKWGVPVWTNNGLVCAISAFKDHVKMNFFKGAYLTDSTAIFNSGLDSKEHRSINFAQSDKLNEAALQDLIKQAINYSEKDQK
jgi:hypothetical protein